MREIYITKNLIKKLALDWFDSSITDSQILNVATQYDSLLDQTGGIAYLSDVADIIYDVLEE